ncbi:GPI mannosyltransferase 2 [Cyphellophora attinorum]|uniref:GPI mannosyltransferase 2 n=1 Tax=Cyphellophora attinorum TaxID=1664694 RepID=A0A0N1NZ57_9EURO|nr:GPI mannosyltransferase 2 [Phialophora attinorum]KPI37825.1 GPI mannosyltransferase 2 [Phialophora attinorum]
MAFSNVKDAARDQPLTTLTAIFVLWKSLLFILAVASPGIGYDTSTDLLDWPGGGSVFAKLVRWDAIYFTQMAKDGHVFEQEWAFGVGISGLLSRVSRLLYDVTMPNVQQLAISGLVISHLSSWLSMLLVWHISRRLDPSEQQSTAFVAASLYIISPAGIFLSAPYTESVFAALHMLSYLLFIDGRTAFAGGRAGAGSLLNIGSGTALAFSIIMRSNGILSGFIFAWDAYEACVRLLRRRGSALDLQRLLSLVVAGVVAGFGFVLPQYLAWTEYCEGRDPASVRSWCQNVVPSIFTFVQSHYWNVGLFRYWTISNIPLFLLAAPTLALLIGSGIDGAVRAVYFRKSPDAYYLAIPQLILAVLALTTYHVQIITRIASGYPWWYIWLAAERPRSVKTAVRWMALYALIQGGLYASFLPPA